MRRPMQSVWITCMLVLTVACVYEAEARDRTICHYAMCDHQSIKACAEADDWEDGDVCKVQGGGTYTLGINLTDQADPRHVIVKHKNPNSKWTLRYPAGSVGWNPLIEVSHDNTLELWNGRIDGRDTDGNFVNGTAIWVHDRGALSLDSCVVENWDVDYDSPTWGRVIEARETRSIRFTNSEFYRLYTDEYILILLQIDNPLGCPDCVATAEIYGCKFHYIHMTEQGPLYEPTMLAIVGGTRGASRVVDIHSSTFEEINVFEGGTGVETVRVVPYIWNDMYNPDVAITNNSFYRNGRHAKTDYIELNILHPRDAFIMNNIIWPRDNGQTGLNIESPSGTVTVDYNDMPGPYPWGGSNNFEADPQVTWLGGERGILRIKAASPCRNAGTSLDNPPLGSPWLTDIRGKPFGSDTSGVWDIGAFEYGAKTTGCSTLPCGEQCMPGGVVTKSALALLPFLAPMVAIRLLRRVHRYRR